MITYIVKKTCWKDKLKRLFSKKYREKKKSEQLKIIKEALLEGKHNPVVWI